MTPAPPVAAIAGVLGVFLVLVQLWDAYETILRDGLAADSHDPAGLYFGTRSGKLFASANGGDSWKEIADALPSICCVKAAVVGAH